MHIFSNFAEWKLFLRKWSCQDLQPNKVRCMKLCFYAQTKKTATRSHRLLVKAYGDSSLSKTACINWFQRLKAGNFYLRNKQHETISSKVADPDLQGFLEKYDSESQKSRTNRLRGTQLASSMQWRVMQTLQKVRKCVLHEFIFWPMELRQNTCWFLLARRKRKSVLHLIVTD